MNPFLKRIIYGLLIGFALITGIGGGTIALLIGIYDELISKVANFRKNPKDSLLYFLPLALGALVSIAILAFPIKLLLEAFPLITIAAFCGLTLGGLPIVYKTVKGNVNWSNMLAGIIGFVFVFAFGVLSWFSNMSNDLSVITWTQVIILFFVAFIVMAGFVAPGVSGSFILIAFGYFSPTIEFIKSFIMRFVHWDFANFGMDFAGFISLALGAIIGLIIITKVFDFALTKNRVKTIYVVLGFIIANIAVAFFNSDIKETYAAMSLQSSAENALTIILSIVLLIAATIGSYFLLNYVESKKNISVTEE